MKLLKLKDSVGGRLLIAAFLVAATQLTLWQVQHRRHLLAASGTNFDLSALPLTLGKWSGEVTELDPRIFKKVGGLTAENRSYTSDTGRYASVHLATFSTTELLLPHPPDLCYTGAGWTILDDRWETGRNEHRYRLMVVEQNGFRAAVAYWYQLGSDVAGNRDELRPIFQKLQWQRKAWPPLVKVLIHIPLEFSQQSHREVTEEFGGSIYEWIKEHS